MRYRPLLHLLFWCVVLAFYTVYFGARDDVYGQSLFFVGLLLPITMATTYLILYWLIPGYLLTRRYFLFGLYFGYILLASLYLEFGLLVGLYVFVADYKLLFISASLVDQTEILVGMYIVVFGAATFHLVRRWDEIRLANIQLTESVSESKRTIERLQNDQTASISVRSDRRTVRIPVAEISYIESMRDYVRIMTDDQKIITKMTLTELQNVLEGHGFTRIHRSFVVNNVKVSAFSGDSVELDSATIPIGRSYRKAVMDALGSQ